MSVNASLLLAHYNALKNNYRVVITHTGGTAMGQITSITAPVSRSPVGLPSRSPTSRRCKLRRCSYPMGLLILFRPAAPTGTLFTITLTASSANVAAEIKQVNSVRVGSGPNVASVIKQDNATRAAASPNIGKAVKQVSATKFAASPNIAVLAKRAGLIRSDASSNVAVLVKQGGAVRSAASANTASAIKQANAIDRLRHPTSRRRRSRRAPRDLPPRPTSPF
jgi:hypothetical protein